MADGMQATPRSLARDRRPARRSATLHNTTISPVNYIWAFEATSSPTSNDNGKARDG